MQIKEISQNMSYVFVPAAAFQRFHFMDSCLQMKQTFYFSASDSSFVRHSIDVAQQTSYCPIMSTNYCSSVVSADWVIKTDEMFKHYELLMN